MLLGTRYEQVLKKRMVNHLNGNRKDLRRGRIPELATIHGDFVMDIDKYSDEMFTVDTLVMDNHILNSNNLFPVYDAKTGMNIGKMTPKKFAKKMLGDPFGIL